MRSGYVLDGWEPGAPILDAIEVDNGAPVVTEAALATFIAHWRSIDPNGTWGHVHVHTGADRWNGWLCMTRSDSDDPDDWTYFPPAANPDTWVLRGWSDLTPLPA